MAYANTVITGRDLPVQTQTKKSTTPRRSLWRRFLDALIEARTRQAEREIARYMATKRFTDASERDIERRFSSVSR